MCHFRSRFCLALAGIAFFLLAACSALRAGYQQADLLLTWRAADYFDLDAAQKKEFRTRLQSLLAWHRYDQLPEYASFLNTAARKAQNGLNREDVVWFINGLKTRYHTIVDRGTPDAAAILSTLSTQQIVVLQQKWNKDNLKFIEDNGLNGDANEHRQARLKLRVEQIEDWTGSLSSDEKMQVGLLLDQVPYGDALRYQERLRRQHEFMVLLKQRNNNSEFQTRLHNWLSDWDQGRSPERERLANEIYEKDIQFYIAVEKILTVSQRERALQRLQQYAEDCIMLSQKPHTALAEISIVALTQSPFPTP